MYQRSDWCLYYFSPSTGRRKLTELKHSPSGSVIFSISRRLQCDDSNHFPRAGLSAYLLLLEIAKNTNKNRRRKDPFFPLPLGSSSGVSPCLEQVATHSPVCPAALKSEIRERYFPKSSLTSFVSHSRARGAVQGWPGARILEFSWPGFDSQREHFLWGWPHWTFLGFGFGICQVRVKMFIYF